MVQKRTSFTLLEMLVVLGIIAVILGALTVSFSTAQKKTRDAKRKADIKAIANALEQYYSICGYTYPANITAPIACSAPARTIMVTVPADPRGNQYVYTPGGSPVDTFTLCANNMELEGNYCITNQQ